jgi:hypothetical protein
LECGDLSPLSVFKQLFRNAEICHRFEFQSALSECGNLSPL